MAGKSLAGPLKYHRYELDVSSVDREKLANACKILRRMNFDNRITLEIS